jgi:hypothetical protein
VPGLGRRLDVEAHACREHVDRRTPSLTSEIRIERDDVYDIIDRMRATFAEER